MERKVSLTQLAGDYSENDLEALEEILEFNYKGEILQVDDVANYFLVAFDFPEARDGLRYVWVSEGDLAVA